MKSFLWYTLSTVFEEVCGHNTRCYHLLMAHCDGDAFCLLWKKKTKKIVKKRTQQAASDSPSLSGELAGDGGAFYSNV